MARKKPYRVRLAIIDLILLLLTAGGWVLVMLERELYMRNRISFALACVDIILTMVTAGFWLFVILIRELIRG